MENLNNQTVITETENQTQVESTSTQTQSEDILNKLDAIIEKKTEKKQDEWMKSMLRDNGLQDDEVKDLLSQWKASKTAKTEKATNDYNDLKTKYDALEKEFTQNKINTSAAKVAKELNIAESSLKHVLKLADTSEFYKDGAVQEDKIKSSFEAVLADIPALAGKVEEKKETNTTVTSTGFKNVGADDHKESDPMAAIRKAMGLPEKK